MGLALLISCACASTGCRTGPPMAPVDLQQPGWSIRRGQAVWQPKATAPELAGKLLIATNTTGETLVRFSKEPMEIVLARRNSLGWSLEIPTFDRRYSGRGEPPPRIIWFQIAGATPEPQSHRGWVWSGIDTGRWALTHRRTGERLEGFFTE